MDLSAPVLWARVMRASLFVYFVFTPFGLILLAEAALAGPFVNELHYDNAGSDVGELIEIAGPAGLSLSGWSIVLYNGATGEAYATPEMEALLGGGLAWASGREGPACEPVAD